MLVAERIGTRTHLGSVSEIVLPGDSKVPDIKTSDTPINRIGWRYPLAPIPFNKELGTKLFNLIKGDVIARRWEKLALNELPHLNEPERSNLHSFLVNVYSYSKAVPIERRDVPLSSIIEESLKKGPMFAEYMSNLKAWLFRIRYNRELFSDELSLTYGHITQAKMRCVGDIFRANQLFFWLPPNPDIVAITSVQPEDIPKFLEEFRNATKEILENPKLAFYYPNNDPNSLLVDNTKSAKEGKNWQLPPTKPAVIRETSRIAFIPRELSESRAAAVESSASVLRIRWIDSEVRRIISIDKRCKMDTRVEVLRSQLLEALKERYRFNHITRRKEKSERWAYCRDFKKEGLTKNRTLLRIMLEELHRRFPGAKAFETYWFFDQWDFTLDGKEYSAKRGHGLGMANALTTFMQLVIEKITKARMLNDAHLVASFYNNDDAALIFDSYAEATQYAEFDRNVCSNLGLAYKDKSTYIAHQHLNFCEQYIAEDDFVNNKIAYTYDTLFLLWKGINASHARSLAMSMNLRGISKDLARDVVRYWGPVLYKNEYSRPRSLGGWFREIENGIDVSFININSRARVPQMEDAANWAYSETRVEHMPWLNFKKKKTKKALSYPEEWLESGDHDIFLKKENTFKAEQNVSENVRAWRAFEKKLRQNFSKGCSWWAKNPHRKRTFEDIYKLECDLRPKEDIIPPIFMRIQSTSFEAEYTADVIFEHPYRAPNQHIDLALWQAGINIESYPRKMGITGLLHIGAKDVPNMKKGPAQRAITLRHLHGTGRVPLKIWNLFLVPSQETFQYWHNPFAIGAVADAWERNYNSYIPTYVSPAKQELLNLRDSFYGRRLSWKEWMTIGTLNPADIILLSLFKDHFGEYPQNEEELDPVLEKFVKAFRNYPGFGKFLDSLINFEGETVIEGFSLWMLANEIFRRDKEKPSEKEKEDALRLENALFERLWGDTPEIATEATDIREFYDSREKDPYDYYEEVVEEYIPPEPEEILEEFFSSDFLEEEIEEEDQEPVLLDSILEEFFDFG